MELGDSGAQAAEVEHTTMSGSYAIGSLTAFCFHKLMIDNAGLRLI